MKQKKNKEKRVIDGVPISNNEFWYCIKYYVRNKSEFDGLNTLDLTNKLDSLVRDYRAFDNIVMEVKDNETENN